jgi:uncharacterized protein involved in response to NO
MAQCPPIFLSYAFRPFFLLSALAAILLAGGWIAGLTGLPVLPRGVNPLEWHAHEMLVGFAMATVAGFTLTAVATWTGRAPVRGAALLMLVAAWLLGRLAMWQAGQLPAAMVTLLDTLFPAGLLVLFGREVVAARNRRNYKVVALIAALALANLVFHSGQPRIGTALMIHTLVLLVALIGGRIVPNFTANWMRGRGMSDPPVNRPAIDGIALALTLSFGLASAAGARGEITAYIALAAAAAHAIRVMQWRGLQTIRNPLLFALHVAYWWLPIGYVLTGLASLGLLLAPATALHALTMGAVGGMVFAMITRVPLGHTGRALRATRLTVIAYLLFSAAVLVRLLGSLAVGAYNILLVISVACWCLAFTLFIVEYWSVLSQPRVDDA